MGAALAVAGAAHAAINTRLVRRPNRPVPQVEESRVDEALDASLAPDVSVLLPVRDEAHNIQACLASLLAQQPADRLEIIVYDDGSSDGTSDIARAAIAQAAPAQAAPASVPGAGVRVVPGSAPPPGWLGKAHACRQLAELARETSTVLVFVDADVRLEPAAVASAVAMLDEHGLDFVSPYPRQLAQSLAERLVQPLLSWSWLTLLPLRVAERAARPSLAVANGQFLVVRRDAYRRAGGHLPDAVLDDIALARALRRVGARGGIVDGSTLASCRMYDDWAALRDGYGKSLWAAFGSPAGASAVVGGLALAYVLPAAAALRGLAAALRGLVAALGRCSAARNGCSAAHSGCLADRAGLRAGLIGYAAGVAGRVIAARRTGGRAWPDALAHPASVATFGWLVVRSFAGRRRGALTWKGRQVSVTMRARPSPRAAVFSGLLGQD